MVVMVVISGNFLSATARVDRDRARGVFLDLTFDLLLLSMVVMVVIFRKL